MENVYDKHMNNGGIYMTALQPENEAVTGVARFGEILVEGCYVANHTGGSNGANGSAALIYHHSDEVYRLAYSYLMNRHARKTLCKRYS